MDGAAGLVLLAGLLAVGCGDGGPSNQVIAARVKLQIGDAQQALAALAKDKSAEGHYLRSVALDRLRMFDAAREQIAMAIEKQPDEPKFQSFQSRLRLYDGKMEDADHLIKLYERNPSSAAVAFCAFYGHEARRARFTAQKNTDAARRSTNDGLQVLKTSIAMASQAPEFQREMLAFAGRYHMGEPTLALLELLQAAAPNDKALRTAQVETLLLLKRSDEAEQLAKDLYQRDKVSDKARDLYASVLERLDATPERDEQYQQFVSQHPESTSIVTGYAAYLARSGRPELAREALVRAIDKETNADKKSDLCIRAVSISLEAGNTQTAEQELNRYRQFIANETLVKYLEGRLLFLKGDHKEALNKLMAVIEAEKKAVGTSRALARETLRWIEKILDDERAVEHLDRVTREISGESGSKTSEPKESKTETPRPNVQEQE